jgi:hypothetical protein
MEGKMTESALRAQDAVRATSFFQERVSESSTRNPPHVDSIIPPSALCERGYSEKNRRSMFRAYYLHPSSC